MTREEIIKGLLDIHAVTANYKGDQVILHSMPMPKLTGILHGAAELLKAQEPPTDTSISSAIECLLHPQDADDSDMVKAIDVAVKALKLLKAQAPRVMTFDELRAISGTDATAFIENRKKPYYNEMAFVKVEKVYGDEVSFNGQKSIFGAKRKDYGIEWRAWTDRPSAAQMKAEPWKEATP